MRDNHRADDIVAALHIKLRLLDDTGLIAGSNDNETEVGIDRCHPGTEGRIHRAAALPVIKFLKAGNVLLNTFLAGNSGSNLPLVRSNLRHQLVLLGGQRLQLGHQRVKTSEVLQLLLKVGKFLLRRFLGRHGLGQFSILGRKHALGLGLLPSILEEFPLGFRKVLVSRILGLAGLAQILIGFDLVLLGSPRLQALGSEFRLDGEV